MSFMDKTLSQGLIRVERAISELRAGRCVALRDEDCSLLVCPVETLSSETISLLQMLPGQARLVLTAPRLKRLGMERPKPGIVALPSLDMARIETLALRADARIDAPVCAATQGDETALELAHLAQLVPAVVVSAYEDNHQTQWLLEVCISDVKSYRADQAANMTIVSRAPVPLEGAQQTEFVIFRGGEGLRDHAAIIIGTPRMDQPVPVRLHSACLTGDLFGSLKCDCGDQLRGSVSWMSENGGGIILYLDQEGRGNGLASKMRAYKLQSQGYDTYEADGVLGYGLDNRRFDFTAVMLKMLGVTRVSLLSNNPEKLAALKAHGLDVVSEQRILGRVTPENRGYLQTKRRVAGHKIEIEN